MAPGAARRVSGRPVRRPRRCARLAAVVAGLLASGASAQVAPADTVARDLGAVEVTASPFTLVPARAPLALAVRQRTAAEQDTDPATALDALGRGLPGLWISDRGNPSTGERVLVRGLGWRAAFGVRGTHVLLDGVPLTLADGQTQLNVADAGLVDRVEVLRGPASTFWGSGSAGVLALSTRDDGPRVRARALGGAYGLAKAEASVRPDLGDRRRLTAWGSALSQAGYREHSSIRAVRGGASGGVDLGRGRALDVVALGAFVPRADSPGGLTLEAATEDPRQTRPISVERNAGKRVAQGHVALAWRQPVAGATLRATVSGGARSLDNPIVPRYIRLGRLAGGARVVVEGGDRVGWGVGLEAEGQRDDRLETTNVGGEPGPDVLTDQVETVGSGAVFGRLAVAVGPALTVTAAARADAIRYATSVTDGGRTVSALSPSLGAAYRLAGPWGEATVYANVAGALDAPTTTELGNRPDGSAGFNPDLGPERTWGGEVGARAAVAAGGGTLGLDAAAFVARVRDQLTPFEVADPAGGGEVTVYRNEGRARHAGVEGAVQAQGLRWGALRLDGAVALTLARGVFEDDGRVPGIPPRLATWTLTGQIGDVVLGLDGEAAAGYAASRDPADQTDAYAVAHVRLALADLALGGARATPFVTVRNVTDAGYAGSVVVNAFGGRFVEPAPGRHVVAGLAVAFD